MVMKYDINEELVILRALELLKASGETPDEIFNTVGFDDHPLNRQIKWAIQDILKIEKTYDFK